METESGLVAARDRAEWGAGVGGEGRQNGE